MIDVSIYITYLLTEHECVILPDFGAFIVSDKKKIYNLQAEPTTPPAKVVSFNSDINHNDGLLITTISKLERITYNEASDIVKGYISNLMLQIEQYNKVTISWLGKLSLSEDNKITFSPYVQLSCNVTNFGLNEFHFPTLSEKREAESAALLEEISNDFEYQPEPTSLFRRAISVVAVVVVLFLAAMPLNKTINADSQSASLISFSNRIEAIAEKPVVEDAVEAEEVMPIASVVEVEELPKQNLRSYHIIVSSLPSLQAAQNSLNEYKELGFNEATVVSSGDKNRISVKMFNNKQEAEIYLEQFRADNPKCSKAWLLSQRN
ncbi:nucleoid DNA-binding protein [Dysgonomonadaceae bacterium PH5-43]|nr:nucleoid DNA-binding protein [Dysgonomonadaceae bacterium PH5-43]